jgi:gluconokinase
MEPDAHGLVVVPLLLGERAPGWERWRGASVLGLTRATRPEEVLRAWLEAVSYRVAGALDALEEVLGPVSQVVASGGAMHASPAWRRILADVLGRRVVLSGEQEETSRGAALVALERLGALPREACDPPAEDPCDPDPARHARYRDARARQARAEALLARLGPADAAEHGGP